LAIVYQNEEPEKILNSRYIAKLNKEAGSRKSELSPNSKATATKFYPAEEYHQD